VKKKDCLRREFWAEITGGVGCEEKKSLESVGREKVSAVQVCSLESAKENCRKNGATKNLRGGKRERSRTKEA